MPIAEIVVVAAELLLIPVPSILKSLNFLAYTRTIRGFLLFLKVSDRVKQD